MDNFLQQLINGLTLGSIYGLIAIGYTMVFGIIGMVNFAHGDVFMLSAFIALIIFMILTQILHLGSLPIAFVIVLASAMALTALWNWAIERLAYRPLRGSFRLAPLAAWTAIPCITVATKRASADASARAGRSPS